MRLNDTVIVTPIDNPGQYDPDWRNSIAMGLAEDGCERVDPVYARYSYTLLFTVSFQLSSHKPPVGGVTRGGIGEQA